MPCFRIYLGIDQTGACTRGGRGARPLPAAWLEREGKGWRLRAGDLSRLDPGGLESLLGRPIAGDCALIVDSVLWPLGDGGAAGLWREFRAAADFRLGERHYGREVASRFFARYAGGPLLETLAPDSPWPRRLCERRSGATSVFQTIPHQRNVQTGTFRIWKELGSHPRWLNVWPFERRPRPELAWLAEGYPTLFWRETIGLARRDPGALRKTASELFPEARADARTWRRIAESPDHADAAVLAFGARRLAREAPFPLPPGLPAVRVAREGWILGLDAG